MGNSKAGRPSVKIDKEQFEKLCGMQCTLEEIASFYDCCDDTINNWCKKTYNENFSGIYKKKSGMGKISLRRIQFKLAEKNTSMAIFLGKQYLGQKDNPHEEGYNDEINNNINNIANLINNPASNRGEEDVQ